METFRAHVPANWVRIINSFNSYMTQDLLGGAKNIKLAWAINAHKLLTSFVVLGLMLAYGNFSTATWLYLALELTRFRGRW